MRRVFSALALTLAIAVAGAGSVSAASLVRVSGPSPYAGCTAGAGPGAVSYTNAEVEPFLAADPRLPRHLLSTWQQDRWSDGGAHGLVSGTSFDAGRTWYETTLPFSTCAPGGLSYERASDPGNAFDLTGISYAIAINFDETTTRTGVGVARSLDGGRTWRDAREIMADVANPATGNPFNDKELIFADAARPLTAYAVWDRLEDVPARAATRQPVTLRPRPVKQARAAQTAAPPAYTGPTYLSRTRDGGRNWDAPRVIVPTGVNEQTIGNYIVVDRHRGTLYDFFAYFPASGAPFVGFVRSDDGGDTWSAVHQVADLLALNQGVTDPNTGEAVRTGDIIPIPAIDPESGDLYVVWTDGRFSGGKVDEVAISASGDQGQTWTAPLRVNSPTGRAAFTPTVAVARDGTVAVTYYDFRHLQPGDTATLPTDYWLRKSQPGELEFGPDIHVAGSFDMKTAPNAGGFFVGDYEGLTSIGREFHPFFVQTNTGNLANRTDVFTGGF